MRTLAVGDIHGCFGALEALAAYAGFTPGDRIVTLGDYVDCGPDSRRVIDWLIQRNEIGRLIPLRGNHEVMMLEARESKHHYDEWLVCGGDAVLSSYGTNRLEDIPADHWHFLVHSLRSHYKTNTHFFVHANACSEITIDEQPDEMLYWKSFDHPAPHKSGLTMVCGHTSQRDGVPLTIGHAVCIDTWAYRGGWLTCLDVDSGFCWQSNESGSTRSFWLDEGP